MKECKLPTMPHIAMKILQVLNDPMTKIDDLQRVILADSSLTAKILQVANSAYYGRAGQVKTLSDAILLLGFTMIKNITLGMAMKDVFQSAGLLEMKLWEHSLGVSLASALVASKTTGESELIEQAMLAGLLHDIGKVVLDVSFPDRYLTVFERVIEEKIPFHIVEKEMFGYDHQDAAGVLFEDWKMPEELTVLVSNHHKCHMIDAKSEIFDLCRIVRFSDTVCLYLGIGYRGPQCQYEDTLEAEAESIGIKFDSFIEEFKNRYIFEKVDLLET